MTHVYLVQGDNNYGHEDSARWSVCAYLDKAKAEEHVRLANEWERDTPTSAEVDQKAEEEGKPLDEWPARNNNPFDPDNEHNDRFNYYITEVPLRTELPIAPKNRRGPRRQMRAKT